MLIVKNLFSLYVEFEILLYFLLLCRLWNVNKDVNMRNEVWNEMDRTYMKKSSKKHFWTIIAGRNNEIRSLVHSVNVYPWKISKISSRVNENKYQLLIIKHKKEERERARERAH
jgi:hypothetical protein